MTCLKLEEERLVSFLTSIPKGLNTWSPSRCRCSRSRCRRCRWSGPGWRRRRSRPSRPGCTWSPPWWGSPSWSGSRGERTGGGTCSQRESSLATENGGDESRATCSEQLESTGKRHNGDHWWLVFMWHQPSQRRDNKSHNLLLMANVMLRKLYLFFYLDKSEGCVLSVWFWVSLLSYQPNLAYSCLAHFIIHWVIRAPPVYCCLYTLVQTFHPWRVRDGERTSWNMALIAVTEADNDLLDYVPL